MFLTKRTLTEGKQNMFHEDDFVFLLHVIEGRPVRKG